MKNIDTKTLIIILLLAGLLLVTPYFIRIWSGNPYIINSESYNNIRLLNSAHGAYYDALQNRHVSINILYLLPDSYSFFVSRILPLLLGIGSVILSFFVLKKYNMNIKNIMAILFLLIVSPIFMYTFSDFNSYAITIFISLLIVHLILEDKTLIGGIIFCILPFIDIYGAVISFIFICIYIFSHSKIIKSRGIFIIVAVASVIISIMCNYFLGYNVFVHMPFEKSNILTDIGANIGYSFSSIILSIIGLVLLWEKGLRNLAIYSSVIILLVLSAFNTFLRIYLNSLLVIYAGFAFMYLMRRKWSIQVIKRVTILLIICSILFSTLVYTTNLVKSKPNPDYVDALSFIKTHSLTQESVLSTEDNGYMIEYFAQRNAYIDQKTSSQEKYKLLEFDTILMSRNLARTEGLLNKNNIRYIFMDADFKQQLEEKQGLLLLIQTSNKFQQVYKNDNAEVWMYIPGTGS